MGCEVFGKFVTIPKVGESGTDGIRTRDLLRDRQTC